MCPFFVFKEPGSQWFQAFLTESSAPHWIEGVWEIACGPPCWLTGPDGGLSKLTRLPIYFFVCFLFQSLLHFENSDMGWGAAHTQECRWVETGSNTHAREVSFHPLAVVRWGGVNTKPMRGQSDSLPDSDMHCLPVNPTTKRYFWFFRRIKLYYRRQCNGKLTI